MDSQQALDNFEAKARDTISALETMIKAHGGRVIAAFVIFECSNGETGGLNAFQEKELSEDDVLLIAEGIEDFSDALGDRLVQDADSEPQ